MAIFKYTILFTIMLLSSAIGIIISKNYSSRVNELKEIKNALNMLETKIKFTYEPLAEIFSQISQNLSNGAKEIFTKAGENMKSMSAKQAWESAINESSLSLNEEDIGLIKKLGGLLGKTDTEGQLSEIELTKSFISVQIAKAEDEKNKNSKMYKTLGTVVGLGIVIILV